MNRIAKIIYDEDGELPEDNYWHFVNENSYAPDPHILCSGWHVDVGAGCGKYITKYVKKGGITCPMCLDIINYYKDIKI